jgi:hypothetical protein
LPRHEPIPIEELDVHPAGSEATGHPIVGREFSR